MSNLTNKIQTQTPQVIKQQTAKYMARQPASQNATQRQTRQLNSKPNNLNENTIQTIPQEVISYTTIVHYKRKISKQNHKYKPQTMVSKAHKHHKQTRLNTITTTNKPCYTKSANSENKSKYK